ncbi:ferritin-like domain-containing protein [Mucilaginibacter ginkgonis]|uniref:Ferritin-like domain-containing protein n=1 Tax=Mucilaginibacter ginkgonis TaxID=2682091 RepID=A0A6I4I5C8_9SPHI|nr:ferritin-like domain-containing protein [Mucilaginibacter ginkgonis]QQL48377.1 ferritin-like domain-containing protein [Mucilaginibacter ginkgonis]
METQTQNLQSEGMPRRKFLRYAGTGAAMAAGVIAASSCKKNTNYESDHLDIGSGDTGILNYAYALEQLEAAFYTQVCGTFYAGITSAEAAYLTDIRDHEVSHRELFKAALGSAAIGPITPNFSSINFGDRASVLTTARTFEDLGVSAYNGAGYMIQNVAYLGLAGKIVSVEARHASLIRNLITYGSFADSTVIDSNGLDVARTPNQVIPIANQFIAGKYLRAPQYGVY